MADDGRPQAWLVPVQIKQLTGGPPMLTAYFAAYADPDEAIAAVKRSIEALEGEDVHRVYPLSKGTFDALALTPGEVRMV